VEVPSKDDRSESLLLAESRAWDDRAESGRRLAALAGDPEIDAVLDRLLLDPDDTAVTLHTAEALLARRDLPGLRPFTRAWAGADSNHGDWLATATYSVRQSIADQAGLAARLRALAADSDPSVRAGAADALTWLGDA
jgi:hypothetical protein